MKRRHFITAAASTAAYVAIRPAVSVAKHPLSEEFLRAVRDGNLPKVRRMLASDSALVYARDGAGRSAYVLAYLSGHQGIAEFLAEQGFLMDVVEATLARNWDRIDQIGAESPGAFNVDHPIGGPSMYAAAISGLGGDMWRLQQYGADPNGNPRGANGVTPARAAVDFPDPILALATVATLLGNGGVPNTPQRAQSSVLHGAAATGNLDMIRLVIRKGGDPNVRDQNGRTPQQVASDLGHERAAVMLAQHEGIARDHRTSRFAYRADGSRFEQPDLDEYDIRLRNRLVGASHFNLEVATSITDQYPALATAISYLDEGAVEAPAHTGQRAVVSLLLERGAPYSLPTAGTMGDIAWATRLLQEDPLRVNERGAHDFAMMWYPAIGGGSVEMAELLVEYGGEIGQEHLGTTGLHFAVRQGHEDLTQFFLEHGADPNAIGRKFSTEGQTPLDHAAARDDGHRLTEMLERAGANRRMSN